MSRAARWTAPEDVSARVRRGWTDGSLLRIAAGAEAFQQISVALKGPAARELGDRVDEARGWADALRRASRDGAHFDLVFGEVGGQLVGRTRIPVRALVSTPEQATALLGIGPHLLRFTELFAQTPQAQRAWVLRNPHRALSAHSEWTAILAACAWIDAHRDSGRYLREITAPGVDTKLVERHRAVIAGLLGVPAGVGPFIESLGYATKPSTVRVRFDPKALGMPDGLSEAVFRLDEVNSIASVGRIEQALIVENEITYLSVPVPPRGIVIWGRGYDAANSASLGWLRDIPVLYWGDLDTHGFAILDRVRAHLPEAVSVLMDMDTLLRHRDRWGTEASPTNADLRRLSADEAEVYAALVTDRHGDAVRLEQERIDWEWALLRLREARP